MHRRGSSRRSSRRHQSRRRRSTMSASSRGSGRSDVLGDEDDDDLVRELGDNKGSRRGNGGDDGDDNDGDDNDDGDNEGDAARDAMQEMVNQEIILCKINRCKELIQTMKQQTWKMSKKMLVLRKARAYVEKVEGKLSRSRGYQQRWNQMIRHTKRNVINAVAALLPWEMRIKRIESHFGSVVASYFTFLRWLIWISLWLAVLPTCFIIIPEMLVGEKYGSSPRKEIPEAKKQTAYDLKTIWNAEGVVKYSLMFYGYYGNARTIGSGYMLPLAYLLASLAAFAFSFIVVLKTMASNSRESQMGSTGDEFPFSWKLFTEWDYMIGNSETATTKHASIITVFKETILEEQEKAREGNKYILLSLRVTANLVILLLLALSTYIIQLFVERSRQMELHRLQHPTYQAGFWNENELTIIMTMIATLFPNVLDLISVMEKYHPRTSLRLMLARIFVLNLLNLYTLFIALYNKQNDLQTQIVSANSTLSLLNCTSITTPGVIGDVSNNCTNRDSSSTTSTVNGDDCWETTIGQEIYKLTVMDTVFVLGQIVIVDIVRSYFIKYCNTLCCWDMEKTFPEYPDFKTAENLLHLISNQGTIWLGSFFAPGLPLLNLLKLLLLLYVRCWTIMTFNAPQQRIFRASRSNNFYFALLLVMLFLCMLPPLLAIVAINPSKDCGPYSGQDKMYHIITSIINDELPESATTILSYSQSPAIILPVFMLLGMVIYYLVSVSRSLKDANQRLAMQLDYERTEGRRKVYAMADAKHESANNRRPSKGWGKAKSKLVNLNKGKQSKMGNIALAAVAMMSKKQEGQGQGATTKPPSRKPQQQEGDDDARTKTTAEPPRTAPKSIKDIAMRSRVTASITGISNKSIKKGVPAIPVAVVKGKRSVKINSQGTRDRGKQHIDSTFNLSDSPSPPNRRGRGRDNPNRSSRQHTSRRSDGTDRNEAENNDVTNISGHGRRGRARNRMKAVGSSTSRSRLANNRNRDEQQINSDNDDSDDDHDDDGDDGDNDDDYDDRDDDNDEEDDVEEDNNDSHEDDDYNHDRVVDQVSNDHKKTRVSRMQSAILESSKQSRKSNNNSMLSSDTNAGRKPQEAQLVLKNKPISNAKPASNASAQPKKSILERIRMFQKENQANEREASSLHTQSKENIGTSSSSKKDEDIDIEANPRASQVRSEIRSEQPHSPGKTKQDNNKIDEGGEDEELKRNTGKTKVKMKNYNRGQFLTPYSDDSEEEDEVDEDNDDENGMLERRDGCEESRNLRNNVLGKQGHINHGYEEESKTAPILSQGKTTGTDQKGRRQTSDKSGSGSTVAAKMEIVNEKVEKKSKKSEKIQQRAMGKYGKARKGKKGLVAGKVPEILVEDFTDVKEIVEDSGGVTKERNINDNRREARLDVKERGGISAVISNNSANDFGVGPVVTTDENQSAPGCKEESVSSSLSQMMRSKGRLAKWRKVASTLIKGKRKQRGRNKNVMTTNYSNVDDSDAVDMTTGHAILGLDDLKMSYLQSEKENLKEERLKRPRHSVIKNNHNTDDNDIKQQHKNDNCLPSTSSATASSSSSSRMSNSPKISRSTEVSRHYVGVDNIADHVQNNVGFHDRMVHRSTHYRRHDDAHPAVQKKDNDNDTFSKIPPSIMSDRRASLASIRSDRPSMMGEEYNIERHDYNDDSNDQDDDDVRSGHYNPNAKTFHYKNHGVNAALYKNPSITKPDDQKASRIRRRDLNTRPLRAGHGKPAVIYGITNAILEVDSESQ